MLGKLVVGIKNHQYKLFEKTLTIEDMKIFRKTLVITIFTLAVEFSVVWEK